jgi:transposase
VKARKLKQEVTTRKRHIAVDTDGRLLMVYLTTAEISDSAGAQAILDDPEALARIAGIVRG